MRICIISDTHGCHHSLMLPKADMLIHAGDFTSLGTPKEILDFNKWLGKQDFDYKVVISGNHDRFMVKMPSLLSNAVYLQDSGIELGGLKIWGSPWTPEFGHSWAFNLDKKQQETHWQKVPLGLDILLTHGPPKGIMDVVDRYDFDGTKYQSSEGDQYLMNEILCKTPRYHVFGHIHECHGELELGKTRFINASIMNENYQALNKPIILDIPKD